MTQLQQAIILVSIIGTILDEYQHKDELTPPVRTLKFTCNRFMDQQSGVKVIPFRGAKIVDHSKYKRYMATIKIGNRLWQKALDRYAKQKLTIEAVSMIKALYDFAPDVLAKHAHISKRKISDYLDESKDGDAKFKTQGAVIGGYLIELLAAEMGIKINGRLSALKNRVDNYVSANPEEAKERAKKDVETIKGVA